MFIFDIEFKAAEQIVEVILAILLFTDATEVPGGVLGREPRLTIRLLLIVRMRVIVREIVHGAHFLSVRIERVASTADRGPRAADR